LKVDYDPFCSNTGRFKKANVSFKAVINLYSVYYIYRKVGKPENTIAGRGQFANGIARAHLSEWPHPSL
jgi:hypothetical protein